MATAERTSNRRWRWALPVVLVAGAVAFGVAHQATASGHGPAVTEETVDVEAASASYPSLEAMTAASDAVVHGEVVATSRGRLVGDGTSAVVSRVLTVQIDEVLGGTHPPTATTLLVEEEGWLPDGRALAVNGVAPTRQGEHGIWFLVALDDAELPGYVTVGTQGRFLDRDGGLQGGAPHDPLVRSASQLGEEGLSTAIRSVGAGSTGGSIRP